MMKLNPAELVERYALLCRSTQAGPMDDSQSLRIGHHLSALNKLVRHDLRALGRQGSPDDFADICFELEQELERFQEFCAFPSLAQKFVVAFGGGFSAGKSSLINALLGKRLLVTEVDPTTSLPTYLLRGDEDAIHAQNLFGQYIQLGDEEFLSLTHDEAERYGSNISRLLRSAIISRSDFPWQNLALIDTPGYTKHEDKRHNERTDEHIARTQLNSAQAIVWVIDARQGCITEDEIKFLTTLRPEIPRLIALSRADQKPSEDVANIISGIRAMLENRNLPFIDVVAVSARKKEWSLTPILEQLASWNSAGCELRFAYNFKSQFTRYTRYLEDERRQAQQHLNRLNRILALADEEAVQQDTQELKLQAEGQVKRSERLLGEIVSLRHGFFAELKVIGNHVGIALPEPSELDLLPEQQGFDLLDTLIRRREAEGSPPPEEPASLRELAQPGDTPKLLAFLSGETDLVMGPHFAAGLDTYCREIYARILAAVAGYGKSGLTEAQSMLFLKVLESLGLEDIRISVLSQARKMEFDDFNECGRIVKEHGLGSVLIFDSLMLSRCGGELGSLNTQLMSELHYVFDSTCETLAGMSVLAGYVLGLRESSNYTSREVLELLHWHPLFFRKMNKKDAKKGVVAGYFKQKDEIRISLDDSDLSVKDAIFISQGGVSFISKKMLSISNVLICALGSFSLNSEKINLENSSVAHGGNERGYVFFGGDVSMEGATFEKFSHISFGKDFGGSYSKKFINMTDVAFKFCETIEISCDDFDGISIRGCEFGSSSLGPILKLKSDTRIKTPPKCTVVIDGSSFICLEKEGGNSVAIEQNEISIEERRFKDSVEVIVSNTNLKQGETTENHWALELYREAKKSFFEKDKSGYCQKSKKTEFFIIHNLSNGLNDDKLIDLACLFPVSSRRK